MSDLTDIWTVRNLAEEELALVAAATLEQAREQAMDDLEVSTAAAKEGDVTLRRLTVAEVAATFRPVNP